MLRQPPCFTLTDPLFPVTTLFRSENFSPVPDSALSASTIPMLASGSSQEPHPPSSRVAGQTHAKGQGQGHHMTAFTDRLSRAGDYARIAHARQVRKGTHVPYLSHVLGVAALVVEYGGNEDQAIAGLLHDTIEDHGQAHEAMIRALFDEAVVDIVEIGRAHV